MKSSLYHYFFFLSVAVFFAFNTSLVSATAIYYNRTDFEAAGGSLATIDFDSFSPGVNLDGVTIDDVTLNALNSNDLIVLNTSSFYGYSSSTPPHMISPGGTAWNDENDDLSIDFSHGVKAAGLDVLFQVPDGASYTNVNFYSSSGTWLGGTSTHMPSPSGNPGYQFVGLITNQGDPLISYILINEFDPTAPDHNIGFDSITYSSSPVPEPSTCLLFLFGMLGIVGVKQKKKFN